MSSVRWTPGCAVQQHVSGCERSVCERHTACVVLCNSIHYSTAVNTIAQLERICFSSARAVNCQIKGFGSQSIPGGRALVQPMDPTRFQVLRIGSNIVRVEASPSTTPRSSTSDARPSSPHVPQSPSRVPPSPHALPSPRALPHAPPSSPRTQVDSETDRVRWEDESGSAEGGVQRGSGEAGGEWSGEEDHQAWA